MNRIFVGVFVAIVLIAGLGACKKDEPITIVPRIKFISMTPNPAVKFQDDIRITIEYTDGDGDLGENTADMKNLFVTDSRNNVTTTFRIPQLSPDNSNIIINGKLTFVLTPQGFIDDNSTSETATYSVYLVDRAGHQSNVINTPALQINS